MDESKLRMISFVSICLVMVVGIPLTSGYTCEDDVYAINNLHVALGYPLLPGWMPFGGDPCLQGWQGVQCVGPNITAIILNGANLGGELGDTLGNFTSIITIDLSNNQISGSIPENLPLTLRQFFLSSNRLIGRIPSSLSDLTLLSDMSLNENLLDGELPDSFQLLTGLMNLDVSSNNLSGPLPPSMASLSSLTTLHLQNNSFSGTLDYLQNLPLIDLNIENNMFTGPVPESLWKIPNFISNGNPFNTQVAPSPSPTQAQPFIVAPIHPPSFNVSTRHGGKFPTINIIAYGFAAVVVIVVVLLALFFLSKLRERQHNRQLIPKSRKKMAFDMTKEPTSATKLVPSNSSKEEFSRHALGKEQERDVHMIETSKVLRPILAEKVAPKHISTADKEKYYISLEKSRGQPRSSTLRASLKTFSVAELQQYTNYFAEENLIRSTFLGRVYIADLAEGKLLTVLKLNNQTPNVNADDFDELVSRISELRHQNIVEFSGYCSEFGQQLLIFKYFSRTTLHDLLHEFLDKRLSWNARIQIAVASAKAIEYLHEFCNPPVILRNIRTTSILVDDELAVRVSECCLTSFVLSNSLAQFSGDPSASFGYDDPRSSFGYEAPEISKAGSYTDRSDVYSFGVVMLELLTGRQPYDRSRSMAEQHLVRWASPRLYDINALSRMVDPSINDVVSLKSLSRFADIINRCIQQAPEFRPSMSQIVQDISLVLKDTRVAEPGPEHF